MYGLENLSKYTLYLGSMMMAGQGLSIYIKNKKNKVDKMATGEVGDFRDLFGLTGHDGFKLSKDIRLNLKSSYEGTCIIGATGSGKTSSFFFPNLLNNHLPPCSLVVSDPKGELYRKTAFYQKNVCGREPILFAPLAPEISYRYNLLENCRTETEVMQLASSLLINGNLATELATGKKAGGIEWVDMATPLFTASLLYCWEYGSPLNNIESAFKLLINYTDEEIDLLFSNASESVKEQYNIFKSVGESERTLGSIKITLATNLKLFTNKKLNTTIRKSEFTAKDLREKPICLYVSYPERMANYLSPFTASFFSQLIDQTIDYYSGNSLPVFFLWDEFANLGQLSNMSVNAATVRSREIGLIVCLQSITQLQQIYGKENTLSILNNLKTKIVLPGLSDIQTLNYISELCGNTEIDVMSKTFNGNNTSTNYSSTIKKLFASDEVRRLDEEELLLIMHNRQPVKSTQDRYYLNEDYLKNIREIGLFKRGI